MGNCVHRHYMMKCLTVSSELKLEVADYLVPKIKTIIPHFFVFYIEFLNYY